MSHPFFDAPAYPWHRYPEAVRFHEALYRAIVDSARIDMIYKACQEDVPPLTLPASPDKIWKEVLENLTTCHALQSLCNIVAEKYKKNSEIQSAIRGVAEAKDAPHQDVVVNQCILSDIVLDRSELRKQLPRLASEQNPLKVVLVRGDPESGKSHTHYLFTKMAEDNRAAPVYLYKDNVTTVDEVILQLFCALDASDKIPPRSGTEDAWYRTVCIKLKEIASTKNKPLWIAIDDLGPELADPTIREFCNQFALGMRNPVLYKWFRLLLIDYPDKPVPIRWEKASLYEDHTSLADIKLEHVVEVFKEWGTAHQCEFSDDDLLNSATAILAAVDEPPAGSDQASSRPQRIHDILDKKLKTLSDIADNSSDNEPLRLQRIRVALIEKSAIPADTTSQKNGHEPDLLPDISASWINPSGTPIIINSSVDAKLFSDRVNQVVRGVVHVSVTGGNVPQSQNTGWLITDSLVVAPGSALIRRSGPSGSQEKQTIICRASFRSGTEVVADLISPPPLNDRFPVLLRLREPLPAGRALSFASGSSQKGARVFILQHQGSAPKQKLSIGTLLQSKGLNLCYNVATEPGSSGSPVLNENGEIIGMHIGVANKIKANKGIPLVTILDKLRGSEVWDEIAQYQQLADFSVTYHELLEKLKPAVSEQALLYAAVHWSFNPKALPHDGIESVKALVIDPADSRWVLRSSERQRLLRSAGSLDVLRTARGKRAVSGIRQQVIDSILQGPPYSLDKIEDKALPYWLHAVRWFSDLVPELPIPQEINRTLERRRIRSRLQSIVGPNFRGRMEELGKLNEWYANPQAGPMVVSGVESIGKSALVAQFALNLPSETLLFWLDFDRADITPDDAGSVLNLLLDQATVQVDAFTVLKTDKGSWKAPVKSFGQALAANGTPVLFILDSLEVDSGAPPRQKIWRLLDLILTQLPTLHILISGRAPLENLTLGKRQSTTLILTKLPRSHRRRMAA